MTSDESKKRSKKRRSSAAKQPKFVGIPEDWETMTDEQQNEVAHQIIEVLFGMPEERSAASTTKR